MAGAVPPALRLLGASLPRAEAPPLLPVELLADAVGRGDDVALLVLVRGARRQGTGRGGRRPGRGWLVCIILLRLDDRKLQVSSINAFISSGLYLDDHESYLVSHLVSFCFNR